MSSNSKSRRKFLQETATITGSVALLKPSLAFSDSASEQPELKGRKPFIIYVHMGSICGVAAGLAQPMVANSWQKGFFTRGNTDLANNPLLNKHDKQGSLIFHEYNKMLGDVASDICLANVNPTSLDHNVARLMQLQGSGLPNASPEWQMGVGQFSRTSENLNPMVLSNSSKTFSVPDVSIVNAVNVAQFRTITSDSPAVPDAKQSAIWQVLKDRYNLKSLGSTALPESISTSVGNQIDTLVNGLPALNAATADINSLTAALNDAAFNSIKDSVPDKNNIAVSTAFRDQLILAGTLAKTGIASGMTISEGGNDLHFGGADIDSARYASSRWCLLTLFWKWIKENNLDNDVMVIVSHDFGRSPYNARDVTANVVTQNGTQAIVSPGRDHGLYAGMMIFNKNVPSKGRIGNVADNFTPVASTDAKGGYDASKGAHLASHVVGSMLMRVYPDLFKTERMVRKHWPDFKEVDAILNG